MPDLRTTWMGLPLASPVVVGAGPLTHDVAAVEVAVAAGAGAVVMYSLFEEQVANEPMAAHHFIEARPDAPEELQPAGAHVDVFSLGAEPYLARLQRIKERVKVPVLASLNGVTPGGWTAFARACEARGADAIELNLYDVVTSAEESAARVEARQLEVVRAVVRAVDVPVTVKLSPFYTSVPAFVKGLEATGAAGATVFNHYYQPDVDLDTLGVDRRLKLSTPAELPLRLHALAMLAPLTPLALACSGGVHSGRDAAKALLCGADVVQVTSVLLHHGAAHVARLLEECDAWLRATGYASSDEARGVLAMGSARDASVFERINYVRMLDAWRTRPT